MIIDVHGHYTTEPPALHAFRDKQLAGLADAARRPASSDLGISDDVLVRSVEAQLRFQKERGGDLTVFSPQNCIPELERIVSELGFVGVNLNPAPAGGMWPDPPLIDRHWYPLYEKLCELDVPAMIHVSSSCNPNFHHTGAHYINGDTTAFMQLIQGNLFKDFPTLRFVIPHGGGAVPFHWGRYRGLAQEMKKPLLKDHLLNNVFFDTCVYHLPGIELMAKVIAIDNILFASEMLGAVKGVDPETGHNYDDTKRYIDKLSISDSDRNKIFEGNARRVYPRLDALLKRRKK